MPNDNQPYVDGFVLVVPKANVENYKKMAELGRDTWMKYGALDYKECLADDLEPDKVQLPFSKLFNLKDDETVVFAYIVFKSREHRDEVNAKVMADPLMNDPKYADMPMPFDMARMAYGGFKVIVSS